MKDNAFKEREKYGQTDFWLGVRPSLEKHFNGTIITVEGRKPRDMLIEHLDYNGIDAYILDRQKRLQPLGSRMNWKWFEDTPSFSLRYELWDEKHNNWKNNREFQRKPELANKNGEYTYPHLHVESFSKRKGSGLISWTYAASTKELVNYINTYVDHERRTIKINKGIKITPPKNGERRLVVSVSVDAFRKEHEAHEIIAVHKS